MKRNKIFYTLALASLLGFTSCEDMFDIGSSMTQSTDNHTLSSAADSLYSVVGILSKVQQLADQNVLLGELRGDLVQANEYTDGYLREVIEHQELSSDNPLLAYNSYYAVINNCNYYLSKVDPDITVSGQKVMVREIATVKAIRAWAYMQLALIFKSVPFVDTPILTVPDAELDYPKADLLQICDYFIADLLPYKDTKQPLYGAIYGYESSKMLFPVKLVLGDLYLWRASYAGNRGDYMEAYKMYSSYLYENNLRSMTTTRANVTANMDSQTKIPRGSINPGYSFEPNLDEILTFIPMAKTKLDGTKSGLSNIFSATEENEGKRKMSPSLSWKELAESQAYQYVSSSNATKKKKLSCGDLRPYAAYGVESYVDKDNFVPELGTTEEVWYEFNVTDKDLVNSKYVGGHVWIYRVGTIYLRMAEALNRMGDWSDAFDILKYGVGLQLNTDSTFAAPYSIAYISPQVSGIHGRGSGSSEVDDDYLISLDQVAGIEENVTPLSDTTYLHSIDLLASTGSEYGWYQLDSMWNATGDTLQIVRVQTDYLVEQVENLIVDEMALETAFEGNRFYDLMRVAKRRNAPAYLADKVARRAGKDQPRDEELFQRLSVEDNWYIRKD